MATTAQLKVAPSGAINQMIRPTAEAKLGEKVRNITQIARNIAPVKTGALRNSIVMRARGAGGQFASSRSGQNVASYEIGVTAPHASYVVRGTRPHTIRAHGPWPLRNRETGQIFGPVVNHPGTKANNFMLNALRQGGL